MYPQILLFVSAVEFLGAVLFAADARFGAWLLVGGPKPCTFTQALVDPGPKLAQGTDKTLVYSPVTPSHNSHNLPSTSRPALALP